MLRQLTRVVLVWRTSSRSSRSSGSRPTTVKVIIEQKAREGPCPECGVLAAVVKDRPVMRIKDLPRRVSSVQLWWRKRRLSCIELLCPRQTFTQTSAAVRPRGRVTERLREQVATAIASGNRAVSEVAAEYGVSWPTAHRALIVAAAAVVAGAGADEPAGDR